jgi:hypothetical protein
MISAIVCNSWTKRKGKKQGKKRENAYTSFNSSQFHIYFKKSRFRHIHSVTNIQRQGAGGMIPRQMPRRHKAMSSNPSARKKKQKTQRQTQSEGVPRGTDRQRTNS